MSTLLVSSWYCWCTTYYIKTVNVIWNDYIYSHVLFILIVCGDNSRVMYFNEAIVSFSILIGKCILKTFSRVLIFFDIEAKFRQMQVFLKLRIIKKGHNKNDCFFKKEIQIIHFKSSFYNDITLHLTL
jgi:hypothetical protein